MPQNNTKKNDKSKGKQAKHVAFQDDACQIVEVEPPSENDQGQRWYSAREVEAARASLLQEERMCMMLASNQEYCKRIDPTTGVISHGKIQAKSFVKALLAQQEEHKMYGIQDARGLYQFSKSLSKDSKKRALEDARSLAFDCQKEISSRELVSCIDTVLYILDMPMPMDSPKTL